MLLIAFLGVLVSQVLGGDVPVLGCLSYKNGACIFCDRANWYFVVGTTCQLMTVDNCVSSYNGQTCSECMTGYYPDVDTGACTLVTDTIPHCLVYTDATTCKTCETGYWVSEGVCKATEVTISQCSIYRNSTACLTCNHSFVKTPGNITLTTGGSYLTSQNMCQDFTKQNCQSGGMLTCVQCKNNYKFFANNYLNSIRQFTTITFKRLDMDQIASSLDPNFSVCAAISVANCLVYQEFYSCAQCASGYFVDTNGQCQMIPDPIISNCFEYLTTGACRQCLTGYYISAPSTCSPHTITIANCATMSMSLLNACVACADGYFLSSNACILRSVKIANCATYALNSEVCEACSPTYLLKPDGSQCFASIVNCYSYTFLPNSIACQYCNSPMYYDSTQGCIKVPASIAGCQFYATLATANSQGNMYQCAICAAKQLLAANGTCSSFDAFIGSQILCAATDQTQKNICNGCYDRQILVSVDNYCEAVPSVSLDENCLVYNTTAWCVQCNNGYFLNNGRCYQISILNCLQVSPSNALQCTKCQSSGLSSYFVSSLLIPNACISTYSHITANCVTQDGVVNSASSQYNTNVCTNCYAPYYPESFQSAMFCVPLPTLLNNYGTLGSLPTSDNCQVWNTLTTTCFTCKFNLSGNFQYVISNGACVTSCPAGQNIKTNNFPYTFFCNTTNAVNPKCTREDGNFCASCASGYLPLVSATSPITTSSVYAYLPLNATNHFKSKMLSFNSTWNRVFVFASCYEASAALGMQHTPTYTNQGGIYPVTIPAVDYSPATSSIYGYCKGITTNVSNLNTVWGCIVCVFGYTGYYVLDNTQAFQFIPSCYRNTKCNYGVYYKGLGLQLTTGVLDFWVSCHVCLAAGTIPTFSQYYRVGSVAAGVNPGTASSVYQQNDCVAIGFLASNPYFPPKCAIQELLPRAATVAYPQTGPLTGVNPICWACPPGYKATFGATTRYVSACALITNCDPTMGSDTFNKCTFCLSGFALNSDMDTCVATTIANCYMVDTSTQVYKCTKCNSGYVVSRDQTQCNTINVNNCLNFDLFYLNSASPTGPYLGSGCTLCELGYIAVRFELPQSLCVYNPTFANVSLTPIPNCFSFSSLTSCSQCSVGYILPIGVTNRCIPLARIPNCAQYNADLTCNTCQSGYILQNAACVDGSLYNTNCATFINQTACSSCATGYILVKMDVGVIRCFLASNTLSNCQTFDATKSLAGVVSCVTCSTGYYAKTPTPVIAGLKGCLTIPVIANCALYNMTTYKCIQCSDAYYLQQSSAFSGNLLESCILRTNVDVSACANISLTSDSCAICISGYYVRSNTCQPKPTGVVNCDVYQDVSTCLKCANSTFLTANLCQPVPTANLITNCKYYRDSATCDTCATGYFLSNNQCLLISVSNCEVYSSATVCQQCTSGYFLTTAGSCQRPLILNCLTFGSLNSCQRCAANYYVNDNQACSAVPAASLIPNCLYYNQNLTCSQCTGGTILSKTATQCLSFGIFSSDNPEFSEKDPNCDAYIYQDSCEVCQGTYLFSNGECVPCNVNLPNCQLCDFNNKTNCIACQSGFSMDLRGQCINNTANSATSQTPTAQSFPYTPKTNFIPSWALHAGLAAALALFAALLALASI